MKTYNIGNYTFIINNKPDHSLKHPYSAYLYKGPKCITGFRSKNEITEDKLIEFLFDNRLLREERSIVE
jgi:hypothetical protein